MSNCNYTSWSNQELVFEIHSLHKSFVGMNKFLKNHYQDIWNELVQRTQFLDSQYEKVSIEARIFCLEHNITKIPECENPNCHNVVLWGKHEFRHHCSLRCTQLDPKTKMKIESTNLNRYGVKHTLQSNEIREKGKQTLFRKYGVENAGQSEEVKRKMKQTNLERYGIEYAISSNEIREKVRRTCIEKYGVESPFLSEEIKSKTRQTLIDKYGVDHYSKTDKFKEDISRAWNEKTDEQLKSIKDKSINTSLNRYGVEYPMQNKEIKDMAVKSQIELYGGIGHSSELVHFKIVASCIEKYGVENPGGLDTTLDKIKQTNLERYGVEYASQSEQVKQKFINTEIERYGGVGMQSKELQEKAINTNLEKYGVEYTTLVPEVQEKIKQSFIDRYGVENPFLSKEINNKIRTTMLERYGVEYYSQSVEYHKNKKHKYHSDKYPGISFDSNWEVRVYEFCKDNGLDVEYSPPISFEYEYDGKIWTYHPDFKVGNKIFEIKGDQFFRLNESTGKEEMFCPYRNPEWSDEHYNWICKKYETKHQCMISNNVIILMENDIMNLTIEFFA